MKKYRKKPVVIEAIQFTGSNHDEISEFAPGYFNEVHPDDRSDDPEVTAEIFDNLHSTWVGVKDGQWIIKGVKGEFYPCAADVFQQTYEAVDE